MTHVNTTLKILLTQFKSEVIKTFLFYHLVSTSKLHREGAINTGSLYHAKTECRGKELYYGICQRWEII